MNLLSKVEVYKSRLKILKWDLSLEQKIKKILNHIWHYGIYEKMFEDPKLKFTTKDALSIRGLYSPYFSIKQNFS